MRFQRLFLLFGILCIAIIGIALFLTLFVRQQHPAGTASYPANIDYGGILGYGDYNPAALANPNIGAVDISMNWAQVEPQPGVFDFGPADKVMADWATAKKKVVIVVRFANEGGSCTNNVLTPSWELAKIPSFCDTDVSTLIPDYFNTTFLTDYKAYVQAVAQHLAASPYKDSILYIRLAVGLGGEGAPIPARGDYATVDKPQIERWGYSPTAWASWQRDLESYYKSVLPFTKIIYPLNGLPIDPTTGEPIQIENAKWAAQQGIGVGQQGLQPGASDPIFQQLRSQYPNLYIQFQTVAPLNAKVTVSCDLSCVAQADIQTAENNGAQFIEWYSQDITNPTLQASFAQWEQYASNKFGGGNSTSMPIPMVKVLNRRQEEQNH